MVWPQDINLPKLQVLAPLPPRCYQGVADEEIPECIWFHTMKLPRTEYICEGIIGFSQGSLIFTSLLLGVR